MCEYLILSCISRRVNFKIHARGYRPGAADAGFGGMVAGRGSGWYRHGMQEIPIVLGFTAGELSPWLDARIDLQAYQRGAGRLCNFTVLPYGGIRRRLGTRMVDYAENQASGANRLVPFRYSDADVLMLEFSPGTMLAYKDAWAVRRPDGEYFRLTIPWTTEAQINSLRFTQVNDVLFVTCPTYPVVKMSRLADNQWQLETLDPEPYPRASYATNGVTLRATFGTDGTTAALEQDTGGNAPFTSAMEGAEYLLADADIPERTYFRNEPMAANVSACPDLSTAPVAYGTMVYVTDTSNMRRFYTCRAAYVAERDFVSGKTTPADYPQHFMPGIMRLVGGKPIEVCGDWEIATHGEWNATWELRRSYDTEAQADTNYLNWQWTTIKSFGQTPYEERKNWALSGSEKLPCRMVLVCTAAASLPLAPMMYFRTLAGQREYKFRITSVTDERHAAATVLSRYLDRPASFATRAWSYGAFGPTMGYPAFSSYYQNRLWFGGIPNLPTTLFASAVDDFSCFRAGSDADDALHLTLASDDQSRICWMCATRELLVGTAEDEWALTASDNGALSATNAAFRRQSAVGSEPLPVQAVENSVLFVQRGGRRLREISYKLESDGFSSVDLSLLAEHLFHSGVAEWCVQRGTDSYIWVLMKDGTLAVLTMNMEQQVTAWQRMLLPDRIVHHIAAIPAPATGEDEIWFVTENSTNHLFLLESISSACVRYVDTRVGVSVESSGEFTGLATLAGSSVVAWREDTPDITYPVQVDADGNGRIVAPDMRPGWQFFFLGRPYVSELRTMPLERDLSFNAVRQLSRVKLRLLESDPHFSYKSTASPRWETYDPAVIRASYPFSGAIRIPQMPDAAVGQSLTIVYDGPREFALQALTVEVDQHGR